MRKQAALTAEMRSETARHLLFLPRVVHETILDRLDVNTEGGIRDVLDAIRAISKPPAGASTASPAPDHDPV